MCMVSLVCEVLCVCVRVCVSVCVFLMVCGCVLLCRVNREKYSGSHGGYFELIFCSFFRIKILSSKSCFNGSEVDRTISCWVPNGEISQG